MGMCNAIMLIISISRRFAGVINSENFFSRLFGNTIWLIAIFYYIYITFLGYNCMYYAALGYI